MADIDQERRLAAILAADVVGYSRLMGDDEAGTLAAVRKLRSELIGPQITEHKGRLFKAMGDGFLAEFPSVVNAVACAATIQKMMAARNAEHADDRQMNFRIGVHLGDVISEGGDVYGDGVNIATRIEGLAPPGGVAVSGMVHDNVGSRLDLAFEDMGEQQLKNIARPVRIYHLAMSRPTTQAVLVEPSKPLAEPAKPSIAVLPFSNMSESSDQQYFASGFTEDVIAELSRWREISVKSRNATSRYGTGPVEIERVARELKVDYVLEGSLRRLGNRIRVSAQLIKTATGDHVWSERFDCNAEEIFAAHDEIVRTIVATMAGRIRSSEIDVNRRRPPDVLAAYECVLRGRALQWGDPDADRNARQLYERAIGLDPNYALAHALLALSMYGEWNADPSAGADVLERAWMIATKAVWLDPGEDMAHDTLGYIELYRRNHTVAEQHLRRALAINPNDPEHMAGLGSVLSFGGAHEDGLLELRRAQFIDPYFEPTWYWYLLEEACFAAHQYDAAIAAGNRVVTKTPRLQARLAGCHAQLGQTALADELIRMALQAQPSISISYLASRSPSRHKSDLGHYIESLRKAGLPE